MDSFFSIFERAKAISNLNLPSELNYFYGYLEGKNVQTAEPLHIILLRINYLKQENVINDEIYLYLLSQIELNSELLLSQIEFLEETRSEEYFVSQFDSGQYENYMKVYIHVNNIPTEDPPPMFQEEEPIYYNQPAEVECVICKEPFSIADYIPLSSCNCIYCLTCFNTYLKTCIEARRFPIKCAECQVEIDDSDITSRIDLNLHKNYLDFRLAAFIQLSPDEYSCCPTADCKNVFSPNGQSYYSCQICRKEYCLKCKVAYHTGFTCEAYIKDLIDKKTQVHDDQFLKFAKGMNYKQCPQCRFWVEKSAGCNHMTCRCTYQFCYVCGGKYMACRCG